MTALDLLFQLKTLIDQEIPPYPPLTEVTSVLDGFAQAVTEGGPEVRREVNDSGGAYDAIVRTWTMFCDSGEPQVRDLSPESEQVRLSTLKALHSITAGFPDLMDPRGFVMITQVIDPRIPEETQVMGLKVIRNICVKSEENREVLASFFNLIPPLVQILRRNRASSEFVHEWCSAVKSVILADDKRVAYNRSAERKRVLFHNHATRYLSQVLNDFPNETPTQNAIVVLLGSMACRDDYCVSMEQSGVLPAIKHILSEKHSHSLLAKNTLSLLRFMNMSSIVREKVCGFGLMADVLKIAHLYRTGRADMVEIALSCCAFMTLRCPCHVAQFLNAHGIPEVMEIMKEHMDSVPVLKGACFTLRNVAMHGSKEARKAIFDANAEATIHEVEKKYPELKYNYTKPLLRDLGFVVSPPVELKSVSQELLEASIGQRISAAKEKTSISAEEEQQQPPPSDLLTALMPLIKCEEDAELTKIMSEAQDLNKRSEWKVSGASQGSSFGRSVAQPEVHKSIVEERQSILKKEVPQSIDVLSTERQSYGVAKDGGAKNSAKISNAEARITIEAPKTEPLKSFDVTSGTGKSTDFTSATRKSADSKNSDARNSTAQPIEIARESDGVPRQSVDPTNAARKSGDPTKDAALEISDSKQAEERKSSAGNQKDIPKSSAATEIVANNSSMEKALKAIPTLGQEAPQNGPAHLLSIASAPKTETDSEAAPKPINEDQLQKAGNTAEARKSAVKDLKRKSTRIKTEHAHRSVAVIKPAHKASKHGKASKKPSAVSAARKSNKEDEGQKSNEGDAAQKPAGK